MNDRHNSDRLQVKSSELSELLGNFEQNVRPKATVEIEQLKEESLALAEQNYPNLISLIKLNTQTKEDIILLATIYASFLADTGEIDDFIFIGIRLGYLLTLMDTLLDNSRVKLTSDDYFYIPTILTHCIVSDYWDKSELITDRDFSQTGREAMDLFRKLSQDISKRLSKLENYQIFAPQLLKLLDSHSQLVTFQHLPIPARKKFLDRNASYEELCIHGSPGLILAILSKAIQLKANLTSKHLENLASIYLPEFGEIHVWVDDIADIGEDNKGKDLNLVLRSTGQDFRRIFLDLFTGFLDRIQSLENQREVIHPLRLMLKIYENELSNKKQTLTLKSRTLSEECHQVLLEAITLLEGRIQQDA